MKPVQALFFDLDNTLFDDDACVQAALYAVHAEVCAWLPGIDAPALSSAYLKHSDPYWRAQPYARGDLDAIRRRLWSAALADLGCDDAASVVLAVDAYRRHRSLLCEVYEDAHETLERLSRRYRLAIVTNGGGEMQRERLRASGIGRHFELVVASTDIDSGKPEPAIFRHALEKLDVAPESAWHIGDSLLHDVAGAHNAGLTSVWLNRAGMTRDASHPEPHHEVASLRQIEVLLTDAGFSMSKARAQYVNGPPLPE